MFDTPLLRVLETMSVCADLLGMMLPNNQLLSVLARLVGTITVRDDKL